MDAGGDPTDSNEDDPDVDGDGPTPQPTALRRQQRQVALGGSVLSGAAVTIVILQRFPESSISAVLAGVVGGFLVYKLAARSIFPGSQESSHQD